MFTGIIHCTGEIINKIPVGDSLKFLVKPSSESFSDDVRIGDSISVNGACMTVEKKYNYSFEFTTINESLKKTNLKYLEAGSVINLEKAMTLNSKLDGHIVQGHVDVTGIIEKIKAKKNSHEFFISFPAKYKYNVIYVGSIAVNGVSLTIAKILKSKSKSMQIKLAIIPHTYNVTNFNRLNKGDIVNIEFDMIGKYVKQIISTK